MMQYSVLMSVYCKESPLHLSEAIESMISQTVPPSDFVLVCDGLLTEELDVVINGYAEKYPELFSIVRLEENHGLGPALKIGLSHCKYEYVARMDADDISSPDRIYKQLSAFEQTPEYSVIGAQISEFSGDPDNIVDYRIVPQTHEDIVKRAARRNPVNHVTVIYKKSDVMKVGGYDDMPGFEDYHLWVKMLASGMKFRSLPDICCNVRVDTDMYGRRGGMTYFKHTLRMQKFLLKNKLTTRRMFVFNVAVRFAGTVLCPNFIRAVLFKKLMRRNTAEV